MTDSRKQMSKRIASVMLALMVALSMMVIASEDVSAASKKPGKVKVTSMTKLNQMVIVKWKKTKNAKKYQIYAKAGKGKWKKVATVKDNGKSKQTYRVWLKWNTKYKLKMRAVNGKKKGSWSKTWKGKLAKKTTLQKEYNKNAKLKKELQKLNADLSDSDIKCAVSLSGNTMVIRMDFIGENGDFSYDLTSARKELKEEFVNAKYKKEMKKQITSTENDTGIKGVAIKIIIYDSAKNLLLNYTYK